jgi:hypothetical protein
MGLATAAIATLRGGDGTTVALADPATFGRRTSGNVVLAATDQPVRVDTLARTAGLDPTPWDLLAGRALDRFVGTAAALDDTVVPVHDLAVLGPLFGRRRREPRA